MSGIEDGSFSISKTKSSRKWHIVMINGRTRCGHEIVGKVLTNVPFDKLGAGGAICGVCLGSIMFDAVRGRERRWNLRRFPINQRGAIRRLRA